MKRGTEVLEADLSFSIGQAAVLLGGQKLDKSRITVSISVEESVEV
jgi:hypothetical protein